MHSFYSSLKTEPTARKHWTLGYLSPIAFEEGQRLALLTVHGTGNSSRSSFTDGMDVLA